MASQVAVAEVAVVPTFKGFRRMVSKETDTSAKEGARGFSRIFAKIGGTTGKEVGTGFKRAFEDSAKGTSDKALKAIEANVAKASRALSTARLQEQDSTGKVRVAEAQLAEARKKYAADSSQVIRAEERLATASRGLEQAHERTEGATDDLRRAQDELASAADRTAGELADAGGRGVKGFRSNIVGGVKSFAGPLVAAFAALGIGNIVADAFREAKEFVLGTITIASDLNESVNAVEVSYGDAADAVLKLGENSAKAFGLSKRDLNGYATQFSSFVKTIAGSGGDVSGTLQQLVTRGTDFASVFNLEVAEALQVFQSGLAGETEPLRKYGIDLSAASVQAFAMANGIGTAGRELSEAEKIQARYGLLLQQTNQVAGDFTNTQDELANKNRINAATWEDLQAKIGDKFLPIASQLATILANDVFPIIEEMVDEHGPELGKAFESVLPSLVELAEELLPQLPGLVKQFADALPGMIQLLQSLLPILTFIAGGVSNMTAVFGGWFAVMDGSKSPEEMGRRLWNMQGPIIEAAKWVHGLRTAMETAFTSMRTTVQSKIDEVVGFIRSLPQRAKDALGDLGNALVSSGRSLIEGFLSGMKRTPIGSTVSGIISYVRGFFPNSPAKRGPLAGSGWTGVKNSGKAFWDQWLDGMGGTGPEFPSFPGAGGGPGYGGFPPPAAAVASGPRELVVVDADRQLIGRMQVEAQGQVVAHGSAVATAVRQRRRGDA